MIKLISFFAMISILAPSAMAMNENPLAQKYIDAVWTAQEEHGKPYVQVGTTNEVLGLFTIDLVTGSTLGPTNRYKPEKRSYAEVLSAPAGEYRWQQTKQDLRVEYNVLFDTCFSRVAPTTFKGRVRDAVGRPGTDRSEAIRAAFQGESTFSLKREGGKIWASVYLKANTKDWENNTFHNSENYRYEVEVTKGSWEGFEAGEVAEFAPTREGRAQYKTGLESAIESIGLAVIPGVQAKIANFNVYRKTISVDLSIQGDVSIKASRSSGVQLVQAPFVVQIWGVTTWNFAGNLPGACQNITQVH